VQRTSKSIFGAASALASASARAALAIGLVVVLVSLVDCTRAQAEKLIVIRNVSEHSLYLCADAVSGFFIRTAPDFSHEIPSGHLWEGGRTANPFKRISRQYSNLKVEDRELGLTLVLFPGTSAPKEGERWSTENIDGWYLFAKTNRVAAAYTKRPGGRRKPAGWSTQVELRREELPSADTNADTTS
jgi:hypothetical protein